jgi:soluble lytic murein transglycosylase
VWRVDLRIGRQPRIRQQGSGRRRPAPARRARAAISGLVLGAALAAVPAPSGGSAAAGSTRPAAPARLPPALDPVIVAYPAAVAAPLEQLQRAIGHYDEEAYGAALTALPAPAAAARTAVPDLVLLYRAKAELALERLDEALADFRRLVTRHPASPYVREAILGQAQALLKLRDPDGALTALGGEAGDEGADVTYYRARALEDGGRRSEALALYRRVYGTYALAPVADLAGQRLLALAPRHLEEPGGYAFALERARNLLRGGRSAEAQKLLSRLGAVVPTDHARADQRLLLLGEAEYNLGRARVALPLLRRIGPEDPERHAAAVHWIGAACRRTRDVDGLLAARDQALESHPRSAWTEKLLYSVATYYDVAGEDDRARKAYEAIVSRFPAGEHAQRARWKAALYAYLSGEYDEALRGFWGYLSAAPDAAGAGAPLFWLARSCERLGDLGRAAYFYGRAQALSARSYYGTEARAAIGRLARRSRSWPQLSVTGFDAGRAERFVEQLEVPAPRLGAPSAEATGIIERARQLASAGLPDVALAELRAALDRLPDRAALSYVMARVYESKNDHYGVIVTLRRAFPQYLDQAEAALPEQVWRLLFPVRHLAVIAAESGKYRIAPSLVLGLIRQESAFREDARSRANARGLMQLLPGTGRAVARRVREPRYNVQKLYKPETNIALGVRHLHTLLERYGGRRELALAAYNAGESRIDAWMQAFGTDDLAQFVEQIPFSETRGYVKQVLSNQAHYERLTGASAASGQ